METKQKKLLIKIKNLINSNNINESKAAERFLKKLLKKYNISLDQLESESIKVRLIKFKTKDRRLIAQIIYSFIEKSKNPNREVSILDNIKTNFYIELTNEEYIELMAMIDLYLKAYEKELDVFYTAFLHKQNLLLKSTTDKSTEEQIKQMRKAVNMSNFIDNYAFRKQIENK